MSASILEEWKLKQIKQHVITTHAALNPRCESDIVMHLHYL